MRPKKGTEAGALRLSPSEGTRARLQGATVEHRLAMLNSVALVDRSIATSAPKKVWPRGGTGSALATEKDGCGFSPRMACLKSPTNKNRKGKLRGLKTNSAGGRASRHPRLAKRLCAPGPLCKSRESNECRGRGFTEPDLVAQYLAGSTSSADAFH